MSSSLIVPTDGETQNRHRLTADDGYDRLSRSWHGIEETGGEDSISRDR